MDLAEITEEIYMVGNILIPAVMIIGIYHLMILFRGITKIDNQWEGALFIALVILSGLSILLEAAQLSDVGKEYAVRDLSGDWVFMYLTLLINFIVCLWGTVRIIISKKIERPSVDIMYMVATKIGLICGIVGLVSVIFSYSGIMVSERYMNTLLIFMGIWTLMPLGFFIGYFILKTWKVEVTKWFDEKQLLDSSIAALIALGTSVVLYFFVIFVTVSEIVINLSIAGWIFTVLFFQLTVFSGIITFRNKM
jgi:hypothetical protein